MLVRTRDEGRPTQRHELILRRARRDFRRSEKVRVVINAIHAKSGGGVTHLRNLLPHLYWLTNPEYQHVYYVDLKPKVFDARIFNSSSIHPNGWGTVLVVGMRLGGGKIGTDKDHDGTSEAADQQILKEGSERCAAAPPRREQLPHGQGWPQRPLLVAAHNRQTTDRRFRAPIFFVGPGQCRV